MSVLISSRINKGNEQMRAKTILALLFFLALRSAAQDSTSVTQAECNFPDGSKITVKYSAGHYRLGTDTELVTVKGINVSPGNYTVFPTSDPHNNWTLRMRKQVEKGQSPELPSVPMTVATSKPPAANFAVSFDQTGEGCTMHWRAEKSMTVLSLEFGKKNTDLPVLK